MNTSFTANALYFSQVDDLEPVAKKIDVKTPQKQSKVSNGHQKQTANSSKHSKADKGTPTDDKTKQKDEKIKIVKKFDSEAKSNCVSAFKESDSWD